jgi:hypothetical protein
LRPVEGLFGGPDRWQHGAPAPLWRYPKGLSTPPQSALQAFLLVPDARGGDVLLLHRGGPYCAFGASHSSEQVLSCEIILRAAGLWLFLGDRNFGVFRIAQCARAKGHHVLLRLTEPRAAKLLGKALRPGDHALIWKPSRLDQLQPGLAADPIPGRLMVLDLKRRGFRSQRLYLFTTLLGDAARSD